jgi:hypothetical protein
MHRSGGKKLVERRMLGYVTMVVRTDKASAMSLSQQPDVISIFPYPEPKKLDERANIIATGQLTGNGPSAPGYLAYLASKGFTQAQFDATLEGVDVSDSGLDNGTQSPNSFSLYKTGDITGTSRVIYNRLEGTPNNPGSTIQGCDGHGNLNCNIIMGFNNLSTAVHRDAAGYNYNLGIAPFARVGSSVVFDPGFFTDPDYEDLQSRAYRDGMRVSSNSWGAAVGGQYTPDSQAYDALVRDAQPAASAVPAAGNQEMIIVFAAGNSGSGASTVGSPGTAKNIISAGAAENAHPFGAADACGIGDTGADSANDIIFFSSRGPCTDGRIKPDLVAAGTHVSGAVAQAAGQHAEPPANLNGQQLACFDASGVCAGPGSNFWPLGQQWTTASSGTSHSTPLIAGAALMTRQYLINTTSITPSATMVKAWLINSARYMNGAGANDNLYSNNQGMGHLNLGVAWDGVNRFTRDETAADLFTATGQVRTFPIFISDVTKPFRVTLAWTDAPGSTGGNAFNNNLDLSVTVGANTYRGNVFTGANSATGGAADTRNNVESVFLPPGLTGAATVTVTATNINSDGLPGNASALDQDFALVAYNVCTTQGNAPTGVTATASGANQIRIDWTGAAGNSNYAIYRSQVSGGPYTQVGSVADPATTFTDSTVSGGGTYFYVVRGVACAESANSNQASATATGACTQPPAFAGITSATNAASATCGINLAWSAAIPSCAGTVTYTIYRSKNNPVFTPGPTNLVTTGVSGTTFTDIAGLVYPNTYYYIVHAVENPGFEDTNTTKASASPTSSVIGPTVRYFDDLDGNRPPSADSYWVFADPHIKKASCHFQSGSTSFRFGATSAATCPGIYDDNLSVQLVLGGNGGGGINGFFFPPGSTGTMTFRHAWDFNDVTAGPTYWDGAILEYSTAGAAGPWTQVMQAASATAPYITAGGYVAPLNGSFPTAWTGLQALTNGSFLLTNVNIDGLAGRTAWFAWHYRSDSIFGFEGHYLDDVRITADGPQACTPGSNGNPGPAVGYLASLPPAANAGSPTPMSIRAVDSLDQTATSYNGTANLSSNDPLATFPATVGFAAGLASPNFTFGSLGARTATATDTVTATITATASTNVGPGVPTQIAYLTQPSNAVAGVNIAPAIRVELRDQFGNVATNFVGNVSLAIGTNPGGDTLHGTTTVAATAGVAVFNAVNIQKIGTGYTLVASAGSATGTSNAFNITAAAASALAFVSQPTNTAAGTSITPAVTARITDAFGNPVSAAATVTVALGANPSGGVLSGTLSQPASGGVATFPNLSIDRVGTGYTLVANSGALSAATSSAFNITPGTPTRVQFGQQPSNIAAGSAMAPAVTVTIRDQFGNLCTQSTAAVSLILGGGTAGATLLGTVTQSAVAGVASFNDLSVDRVGLLYTLTAGSAGLTTATSGSFNVTAGAPASLAFTTQPPATRVAGATFSTSVTILDQYGNRTSSTAAVTVAINNNPGGGTLSGTTTVNAVNGIATFPGLSINKVGVGYTLDATSGALASATSNAFNITPAAASVLRYGQQPSSSVAGAAIAPAVTVRVEDAFGNLVTISSATISVAIGNNPGGGTLSGVATSNASGGVATFSNLSINRTGVGYTLVATSGALTSATSAAFDITAGNAASLSFTTQPSTTAAGATIAPAVVAQARDALGNVATGFGGAVTLTLNNGGTAVLAGTATVNAIAGVATFSDLSIAKSGTGYTLTAAAAGVTSATSSAFNIVPGAAAALAFVTQPTSSPANAAFSTSVAISDAFGNLVTGATNSVTLALATNPGGGTLSGTLAANASGGVASFSGLSIDRVGLGYQLSATSAGLTSATSALFDIGAGPAVGLEFVTQPSNAAAGAAISPAVVVRIVDASGNTASGGNVTLAIANNAGGGTLSGTATVTPVTGVATFANLSIDRAGTGYTLRATSGALPGLTSSAFNIANGAAAVLAFSGQPTNATAGATIAPAVTVEARDAFGNVDTSFTGSVSLTLGGGASGATLGGTASATATAGVASFSDLSIARAGTAYTLTAAATGVTSATSNTFDIAAGGVATLEITGLAAGVQVTVETTFGVTAKDSSGNVAAGYAGTVHFTSDDAQAVLPANATLAAGVATGLKVTFRTAGTHTLTATDTATSSLTATASINVTAFAAPTVALDGAADGDTVSEPVHLTATGAAAAGTSLTRLEIFVDGVSLANGATSPLSADWDPSTLEDKSEHTITATATDATGNSATTAAVHVTIEKKGGCGCSSMGGLDVGGLAALGFALRALALRRRRPSVR